MRKKQIHVFTNLSLLCALLFLLGGCGQAEHHYTAEKRAELMRRSTFVVQATWKETRRLDERHLVDIIEGRDGHSAKIEQAVFFRIRSFLKGGYGKDEISVGVDLPSMSLGIGPNDYPGQKLYTLYVGYSERFRRSALIGAEWEEFQYTR